MSDESQDRELAVNDAYKHELDADLITELKKRIEWQEDEIFQLKEVIETLPGDIYWKDRKGMWLGVNTTGCEKLRRFGVADRHEAIIGKTDYELFDKKTADKYRLNDEKVMETKEALTEEEDVWLPSGEYCVQLSKKRPLYNRQGEVIGIIGNTVDITNLKRVESDLRVAKEAAENANHAKTRFLHNMRHDIRTPFSGIYTMAQHMAELETDTEKKQNLSEIARSAKTLLAYLNEILEFTQIESGNIPILSKPFDFSKLVENCVDTFRPSINLKQVSIESDYRGLPDWIISDRFRIQRIIINLLSNAVKFTERGEIKVVVEQLESLGRDAIIKLAVEDTGPGIPEEKQVVIFEKFGKLGVSYDSTNLSVGLGLYAVKALVNDLNGDVFLKSQAGRGSVFSCVFRVKKPLTTDPKMLEDLLGAV